MATDDEEMVTILSHSQDSVIKDSKNRTYVNLIIFLQAGIGLAFITVPFVISVYRNRAVLHRINRRVQWFQDRKDAAPNTRGADATEDHFSRQLLQVHPNLTPHELRLCSLLSTESQFEGNCRRIKHHSGKRKYRSLPTTQED